MGKIELTSELYDLLFTSYMLGRRDVRGSYYSDDSECNFPVFVKCLIDGNDFVLDKEIFWTRYADDNR